MQGSLSQANHGQTVFFSFFPPEGTCKFKVREYELSKLTNTQPVTLCPCQEVRLFAPSIEEIGSGNAKHCNSRLIGLLQIFVIDVWLVMLGLTGGLLLNIVMYVFFLPWAPKVCNITRPQKHSFLQGYQHWRWTQITKQFRRRSHANAVLHCFRPGTYNKISLDCWSTTAVRGKYRNP